MDNLLSYCGLTDARMSASEKDLSVKEASGVCVWFDGNFSGTENEFMEKYVDQPRNKYGRTKREAERLCLVSATNKQQTNKQSVLVLRAPRFFCEDVLPPEG